MTRPASNASISTQGGLIYLKPEMTFEGTPSPDADTGELQTIFGEGTDGKAELQLEHLSEIVAELNERFAPKRRTRPAGVDQMEETWVVADPDVVAQAHTNTLSWPGSDENEAIVERILDHDEFRQVLTVSRSRLPKTMRKFSDLYAGRLYRRARQRPESMTPPRNRSRAEPRASALGL